MCYVGTGSAALCHFREQLGPDCYVYRSRSVGNTPLACSRSWWAADRWKKWSGGCPLRWRRGMQGRPLGYLSRDGAVDDHGVQYLPDGSALPGESARKGDAIRWSVKSTPQEITSTSGLPMFSQGAATEKRAKKKPVLKVDLRPILSRPSIPCKAGPSLKHTRSQRARVPCSMCFLE